LALKNFKIRILMKRIGKKSFRNSWILIFLIFMNSGLLYAQDYIFRVFGTSGNNLVNVSGKWQPLQVHQLLHQGEVIRVVNQGYVALIHVRGNTMELTSPGDYEVDRLDKKSDPKKESFIAKYVNLLLNNFSGTGNTSATAAHAGAVERGVAGIKMYIPDTTYFVGPEVILQWHGIKNATGYKVSIKNIFDDVVEEQTVSVPRVKLDFSQGNLADRSTVFMTIESLGETMTSSAEFGLTRLDKNKTAEINSEMDSLQANLSGNSALDKLVMAAFYEKKGLYLDAMTQYSEAAGLQPGVPEFRDALDRFMERRGISITN
jgi:hypothetical protein